MVDVTEVSASEGEGQRESRDLTDTEGEGEDPSTYTSLFQVWQSTLVVIVAVLVIQAQVFFASSLFNVLLRWWVLPKGNAFTIPFHPDYQEQHPAAYIPMLEDKYLTSGQMVEKQPQDGSGLLVRDGSYFDVWLKLSLPYSAKNEDLFQVQVDLLAPNSSVVFSDRKACLMTKKSFLFRHLKLVAFAPLYLSGFMDQEQQVLYFPVVDRFKQGNVDQVVSQLKVSLLPQAGNDPPELYEAEAHILVKLNMIQHFMYHYPITSFAVFSLFTALFLNSILLGLLLVVLVAIMFGLSDSTGDSGGDSSSEKEEEEEEEDYTEATSGGEYTFTEFGEEGTSNSERVGEGTTQVMNENVSSWGKSKATAREVVTSDDDDVSNDGTKVVKAASVREHITETRWRKA
jgi:hypothetical protein